jgi:type IV pilus assembly protein PilA
MARDQQGVSLIELLIVVAIVLVIAAIAIPNLMRSRIAANQASAIESCRMVNTAEVAYYTSYGVGYSSSLIQLAPPAAGASASSAAAGYLDSVLGGGFKSGYLFVYAPAAIDPVGHYQQYTLNSNPSQPDISGTTYYFTDYTHVIRGRTGGPASAADTAVAQ